MRKSESLSLGLERDFCEISLLEGRLHIPQPFAGQRFEKRRLFDRSCVTSAIQDGEGDMRGVVHEAPGIR